MSLHPGIVVGVFILVVLTTGLALLGLFLIWRNGFVRGWRASRSAKPKCPRCGYDMTGLTHCRCPECGRESRIEDIMTSLPEVSMESWRRSGDRKVRHR
jgi:hypothetical protein